MAVSLSCNNIEKSFGKVSALKNITFEVNRGEIFGVIGPDGAGKSTLFRILTTLLLADKGSATVDGFDVVKNYREIRNIVGYMPGKFSLYQDLTVEENLRIFATLFKTTIQENYHLIKDIYSQIEPFKKRMAGALSGGMKQKLALSCALIHKPTVLFLDEPTTGIDPVSRRELWEMLRKLKYQGITIIVSTPYMDEASLCDRIALIQNGEFLKIDTPHSITQSFSKKLFSVKGKNMGSLLNKLREVPGVVTCFAFGDSHHVTAEFDHGPDGPITPESLRNKLNAVGEEELEISLIEPSIEDCFMDLIAGNRQN